MNPKIVRSLVVALLFLIALVNKSSASSTFGIPTSGNVMQLFLAKINYETSGSFYDQDNKLKSVSYKFHHGIDIAGGGSVNKQKIVNSDTKPNFAIRSGEVLSAGFSKGYGHQVVLYIGYNVNGNKKHTYILYNHMGTGNQSFIEVNEGQSVNAGQRLGRQGNSGYTFGKTGIHLDFEIRLSDNLIKKGEWTSSKASKMIAASPDFYFGKQLTAGDINPLKFVTEGPFSESVDIDPKYLLRFDSVGGVRIGDSIEKAKKVFGEPKEVSYYRAHEHMSDPAILTDPKWNMKVFEYEGLELYFSYGKLAFIVVNSPNYRTIQNIGKGSLIEELLKTFSGLQRSAMTGGYYYEQQYGEVDIKTEFLENNGKVDNITIGIKEFYEEC